MNSFDLDFENYDDDVSTDTKAASKKSNSVALGGAAKVAGYNAALNHFHIDLDAPQYVPPSGTDPASKTGVSAFKKAKLKAEQLKKNRESQDDITELPLSVAPLQEMGGKIPLGGALIIVGPEFEHTLEVKGKTKFGDSGGSSSTPLTGSAPSTDISPAKPPSLTGDAIDKTLADTAEKMGENIRFMRDFEVLKTMFYAMNPLSLKTQDSRLVSLVKRFFSSIYFGFILMFFILVVNILWTVYVHTWENVIPSQLFFLSDVLVGMTTLGVFMALIYLFGCRKREAFLVASLICIIMSCIKPNVTYFDSTIPDLFNNIPRKMMEKYMFSLDRNFNVMTPIVQIFKIDACHEDRDHPMCVQGLADIANYKKRYEDLIIYMGNHNPFGLPETVYGLRLPDKVYSEYFVGGDSGNKSIMSFDLDVVRNLEHKDRVMQLLPFLSNRFRNGLYLEHVYKDSVNMYNTFRHALSASMSVWKWFDKSNFMFFFDPVHATFNRLLTTLGVNGINFILTTQDFEIFVLEWINYWHYVVNHVELPQHRMNLTLFLIDGKLNRPKDLARVGNNTFDMCTYYTCVSPQSIKAHNVKIASMTQNLKKKISADQHAEFKNMTFNDIRHTAKVLEEMEKDDKCPLIDDESKVSLLTNCPDILQVTLLLASVEISRQPALARTMCPPACLNTYFAGCAPIVDTFDNSTPTFHKEEKVNLEDPLDSQPLPDLSWWAYMETVLGYFVVFLQHSFGIGFGYMWATLAMFLVLLIYDHFKAAWERRPIELYPSHTLQGPPYRAPPQLLALEYPGYN